MTTTTAITFADSVECAKAHIMNIYEMYAVVSDNVADAKHDRASFAVLVAEFILSCETYGWLFKFPEWAKVDYGVICSALAELVEEWEE